MKSVFSYAFDRTDAAGVFAYLKDSPYSIFLDSAAAGDASGRYSFIAFHPFETIESRAGRITVTNREQQLSLRSGDPFLVVKQRLEGWGADIASKPGLPPFQGGAAGYFGYDLARTLERLPVRAAQDTTAPDMAVGLYDRVVSFDHREGKAWFVTLADNENDARRHHAHFLSLLDGAPPVTAAAAFTPDWVSSFTRAGYEAAVKKVVDYIHAGDIFQANIAQRFSALVPPDFDAFAHYLNLRAVNPAPFACFMNCGPVKILSASPERFLRVENRHVETRPIKGTRPRLAAEEQDIAQRHALAASAKDRAENVMIVDLLRNDLSKVCEDFSVEVPSLCAVESFARVHHLVSTVTGTLRADKTPIDLLHACFPGGSVTGAPKVRAMEIIEEIEPQRRAPYCGAIGYIGFNGAMDTSIAIRTLVCEQGHIRFSVGGGIVAESDPAAEYQETLDKAAGMFESFNGLIPLKARR